MPSTINNPKIANVFLISVVIISSFLVVVAGALIPTQYLENHYWIGFLPISFSIFAAAYFLPESTVRRFSSRQSAIAGGCLFLMAGMQQAIHPPILEVTETKIETSLDLLKMFISYIILFIIAISAYWLIFWAIRGLKSQKPQA